jgi:hypothetical protein
MQLLKIKLYSWFYGHIYRIQALPANFIIQLLIYSPMDHFCNEEANYAISSSRLNGRALMMPEIATADVWV